MAKKRKLNSKSAEASQSQQYQQEETEGQEEQHEDQENLNGMQEDDETHEIEEGTEDDARNDGISENINDEIKPIAESSDQNQNNDEDDDDEPVQKLLEPFSKEQLINLLSEAAVKHPDVVDRIRGVADQDPSHRKIFVHGLSWDANAELLTETFKQYGDIEDCKVVTDKVSGKSKGYGFILFRSRSGAIKSLKQPQKKIGSRMTSCQLASLGPAAASVASGPPMAQPVSELTQRKIYVTNVGSELDPQKLTIFFSKYGEIEQGPLGLDKETGKPKGFCLFVYKTIESAKKALEEPHKNFEGHILLCQKAIDGPKSIKQNPHQRNLNTQNLRSPRFVGNARGAGSAATYPAVPANVGGMPFNQGATPAPALNPALGQALTAFLATQGAGLGLTNLISSLGAAGVGAVGNQAMPGTGHGVQPGYGNQGVAGGATSGVVGGYGAQGGYRNQQMGQGGPSWPHTNGGHMGGMGH